jgi:hypothetical protein
MFLEDSAGTIDLVRARSLVTDTLEVGDAEVNGVVSLTEVSEGCIGSDIRDVDAIAVVCGSVSKRIILDGEVRTVGRVNARRLVADVLVSTMVVVIAWEVLIKVDVVVGKLDISDTKAEGDKLMLDFVKEIVVVGLLN